MNDFERNLYLTSSADLEEQQIWTGWSEFKTYLPIRKLKTLQVA